jgi:hypothetical protein
MGEGGGEGSNVKDAPSTHPSPILRTGEGI